MIDLKTLSAEWIAEKRKKYSKDPAIMESMIYALYLLEQLQLSNLKFIFKGGTSLILLMKEPKRFSLDIDIIVRPTISKEELEKHLSEIIATSVFKRLELDERRSYQGDIPKAHYKFIYNSNFASKNELTKFSETIPLNDYLITNTDYNFLNKRLKFVAKGEALFYWYQTIKILAKE